jgi:metal-sulfur cluster biosynthetic enzyme
MPILSTPQTELLNAESCREALKAVIDPEIFQNIVDLGLVYGVEVIPEQAVHVTMTLTTPHCPMGPQILENVERTLKSAGASAVTINIVWQPPWTPYAMTPELQKQLGILSEAPPEEEEIELLPPPPPPTKKKGLISRIFGR